MTATSPAHSSLEPAVPPRILWINARLLHPLNGGDRIRTYQILRHLKKHSHITYLCPKTPQDSADSVDRALEYCHEVLPFPHRFPTPGSPSLLARIVLNCLVGNCPFAARKYASPTARQLIDRTLEQGDFDLVIADYLVSWIHLRGIAERLRIPTIVFQHNVESLIWQRHAAAAANPVRKWIYQREWRLTQTFEDEIATRATGQIAVSQEEEQTFRDQRRMKNILGWVPTGVDCEYFSSPSQTSSSSTLAFLGSMDWQANVEAIAHFVTHSYPLIKRSCPQARLILIGRNPTPKVRALAAADPSIEVTGTVDDVRPYLARASIMILPLRVGGGTRIKVFEAMAAGLALVSSRIGVEGLPVVDGEHALLADDPDTFAERVVSLIQQPERRALIAKTARDWVAENFGWETAAQKFLNLCHRVLPGRERKISA